MKYRFCPICGSYLNAKDKGSAPSCPSGHYTYQPQLGVEVAPIVSQRQNVLLQRCEDVDGTVGWQLPTASVRENENPQSTIHQLIAEMTGEDAVVGALVNLRSNKQSCTLFYEVQLNNDLKTTCTQYRWFSFGDIPWTEFLLNTQRDVLTTWIQQQFQQTRGFVRSV